jgi:hypothetical protein
LAKAPSDKTLDELAQDMHTRPEGLTPLMAKAENADFVCPKCTSHYKLVRVRPERGLSSRRIYCKAA